MAGLLDRFGFTGEAEAAYKAFMVRNPNEPERVLVLASFLARQDRTKEAVAILEEAWKTCRPEAVATDRPGTLRRALRRSITSSIGWRHGSHEAIEKSSLRGRAAPPQARRHLLQARTIRRGRGPLPPDPASAIPTTSRRSTTWPGSSPSANRASRGKPSS